MPGRVGAGRAEFIRERHGIVENVAKDLPGHVLAGFGDRAAMDGLRVCPYPTSSSIAEQGAILNIHPSMIRTGDHG